MLKLKCTSLLLLLWALCQTAPAKCWSFWPLGSSASSPQKAASVPLFIIRPDDDSVRYAIRLDADTTGHSLAAQWDKLVAVPIYYNTQRKAWWKDMPIELCATMMMSRGYYKDEEWCNELNAGAEITALYRAGDWSFGLTTGLYHSVGRNATRYIPTLAMAEYRWPEVWLFTPIAQAYFGAAWGIGQGTSEAGRNKYPTCALGSLRAGLLYPFSERLTLQCTVHLFQLTNNRRSDYPMSSETNAGLSGGIRYSF